MTTDARELVVGKPQYNILCGAHDDARSVTSHSSSCSCRAATIMILRHPPPAAAVTTIEHDEQQRPTAAVGTREI